MRQYSKNITHLVYYRLPVVALCILLFWQSSYPGIISEPLFAYEDKVLHFLAYCLLSFLCARDLKAQKPFWSITKIKIITIIFACLYGLSDEIHQSFVPSRFASTGDFIADCAGSIAGCFFYLNIISRNK
jgi:VanZ family protein